MSELRTSLIAGVLAATLATCSGPTPAEPPRDRSPADSSPPDSRMALDETVISGNQELPKVLYIVPWQQPDGKPDLATHGGSLGDALFQRVRPAAHQRELLYLETLQGTRPED